MEIPQARTAEAVARAVALADQCVRCGLCLPHCPSYRVRAEEGESPRGRIVFARALALGTLERSLKLAQHLDGCLACGVCEEVCPSRVSYIEIVVATRAAGTRTPRARAASRWLRAFSRSRVASRMLLGLRGAHRLARHARAWPRLAAALEALAGLPDRPGPRVRSIAADGAARAAVALFRGCIAREIDADTHAAATRVLSRLGYDVTVPTQAHCCGALALHAGETGEADCAALAAAAVFRTTGAAAIVTSACGCTGQVHGAVARAAGIAGHDVLALIASDPRYASLPLRSDPRRVALMLPCTQTQAGGHEPVRAVLARIPGLDVRVLPLQPRCCGAAGTYFIEQPEIAMPLRDERVDQILALAPDLVVTTNVGCRIYLQAGLRARGSALEVCHPITLVDGALTA
ncbi:MAG TPA: (Fe-S)-binding protein [Candidatus Saccharimonadia bacterium]|nr:(Fe-S)-binding protein [Candidatus Saccharimonadia bacterium]